MNATTMLKNTVYGSAKKVWWKCSNGHEWQTSVVHRTGQNTGCPKCTNQSSTQEIRIFTEIRSIYPDVISRYVLDKKEIDVFIPSLKLGIEFDGAYYHANGEDKDQAKTNFFSERGIGLIRVRQAPLTKLSSSDVLLRGKVLTKHHMNLIIDQIQRDFDPSNEALVDYKVSTDFANESEYKLYLSYFPNPFPENSLEATHPHLLKEWDTELNHPLEPKNFTKGSEHKVWWRCGKNSSHVFEAAIYARANGNGCPYCRGLSVDETNSLHSNYPDIAKQWDFNRNYPLTPRDVVAGSSKKVWWKCEVGDDHRWESRVSGRTSTNGGCPFCSNQRVCDSNCLANDTNVGHIFSQWDIEKNKGLTPTDVTSGSSKKIWWVCDHNHSWYMSVYERAKKGMGCPYCSNQRVHSGNTLESMRPDLVQEWDWERNSPDTPSNIMYRSAKKYWWICQNDPKHHWDASLSNRVRQNSGCPYCTNVKVSEDNCLASSEVDKKRLKQWDFNRNYPLTPRDVVAGSSKKVWWKCEVGDDHRWEQAINARFSVDALCPFCEKQLPSNDFNLEVAFPELMKQWFWERNADIDPSKILPGSNRKVWWKCDKAPDHMWEASIAKRTIKNTGCPYCANRLASVTNSIESLYPELAKLFDERLNEGVRPENIVATSAKKYWWKCPVCKHYSWESSPRDILRFNRICPECSKQQKLDA